MKKLLLLTKTLLAVALLCVGQNAWGDATTLYEKGTTGHDWANADLTDWVLSGTAESSIDTKGLKFAKTAVARTEYTYTKSLTTTENAKVSMDLEWIVENANGSATAGCSVNFGDVRLFWCGQNRDLKITIGGTETSLISGGSTDLRGTTFNVNIVIDKATKDVEYSISNSAYNSGTAIEGNGTASTSDVSSVAFGWSRGGQQNVSSQIVKSIVITEEEQAVTATSYTVNYKLGDNVVKTVSNDGVVDQVVTADVAIDGTEEGYVGNHYLITAGVAPSMTLVSAAASNVLDVPVRAPYTATLNVTTTVGTNDPVLVSTPLTETDAKVCTWSYAYPLYVKSGDVYYKADNVTTFGEGGVFTDGQVINKSVTYSTAEEDVVFFYDQPTPGTSYAYSNGATSFVAAQNAKDRGISVGTLDAGTYSFVVNITAANRRSLGIRQSTNDHIASVGTSNEDLTTGVKSANFTLDAETSNLYINGANSGDRTNQSEDFDYIIIKKLPSTVSATIGATGWATFSSDYALDFTGISDFEAYMITGHDGTVVTKTPVTGTVPAGTGLLLKGDADNYTIPVVASSSTDVSANKLVAGTGASVSKEDNMTKYVLGVNGENAEFQKIDGTPATVDKGKAYLVFNGEILARTMRFSGDVTAIENVEAAAEAKAKEGKFIENGKLVIVKNGQKFNAAGAKLY